MTTEKELGEIRHEKCIYGKLSEAWFVPVDGEISESNLKPTVIPSCLFSISEQVPPWVERRMHDYVEYDRDCAVCKCFSEITIDNEPD